MMTVDDDGSDAVLVRMQCDSCGQEFSYIAFNGDPPTRIGSLYGMVFRSDGKLECMACGLMSDAASRALRDFHAENDNSEGLPGDQEESA